MDALDRYLMTHERAQAVDEAHTLAFVPLKMLGNGKILYRRLCQVCGRQHLPSPIEPCTRSAAEAASD